jgi:hypothetical protein
MKRYIVGISYGTGFRMWHKTRYYNMRLKRVLWLNGKALNQEEIVQPEWTNTKIGP